MVHRAVAGDYTLRKGALGAETILVKQVRRRCLTAQELNVL